MPDKGTKKKVIRVGGGEAPSAPAATERPPFAPTPEGKGKAKSLRLFAILAWVVAIGLEIAAIFLLRKPPINTTWLIALIVADLIFAVIGSLLWKRSNRLDPASERDKFKFFVQNQLGAIISVIAFLPLVLLIFTNKDLSGKQKGLVGGVAVAALLVAAILGVEFNPPSQEQYAGQAAQVESLTGTNLVYWTKSGTRYHLYSDCYHINTSKTEEIYSGTVAQAKELKNITELCSTCRVRAEKEKALATQKVPELPEDKK